jgi:5-methylcytosine-specific restriction endonuclease McrA
MTNSGYIPDPTRTAIAKRDRGVCRHCGRKAGRAAVSPRGVLQFFDADGRIYHIDHLIPTAMGGTSDPENLALACAPCNQSKRRRAVANDPDVMALLAEFG